MAKNFVYSVYTRKRSWKAWTVAFHSLCHRCHHRPWLNVTVCRCTPTLTTHSFTFMIKLSNIDFQSKADHPRTRHIHAFCCYDLDRDPIYEPDLDIPKMYLRPKNEVSRSRLSKIKARTEQTQTDVTESINRLHSRVVIKKHTCRLTEMQATYPFWLINTQALDDNFF